MEFEISTGAGEPFNLHFPQLQTPMVAVSKASEIITVLTNTL